jgi:hypothetical protein
MGFDEPHLYPERSSLTRLSMSGHARYRGRSCIIYWDRCDKFVCLYVIILCDIVKMLVVAVYTNNMWVKYSCPPSYQSSMQWRRMHAGTVTAVPLHNKAPCSGDACMPVQLQPFLTFTPDAANCSASHFNCMHLQKQWWIPIYLESLWTADKLST